MWIWLLLLANIFLNGTRPCCDDRADKMPPRWDRGGERHRHCDSVAGDSWLPNNTPEGGSFASGLQLTVSNGELRKQNHEGEGHYHTLGSLAAGCAVCGQLRPVGGLGRRLRLQSKRREKGSPLSVRMHLCVYVHACALLCVCMPVYIVCVWVYVHVCLCVCFCVYML